MSLAASLAGVVIVGAAALKNIDYDELSLIAAGKRTELSSTEISIQPKEHKNPIDWKIPVGVSAGLAALGVGYVALRRRNSRKGDDSSTLDDALGEDSSAESGESVPAVQAPASHRSFGSKLWGGLKKAAGAIASPISDYVAGRARKKENDQQEKERAGRKSRIKAAYFTGAKKISEDRAHLYREAVIKDRDESRMLSESLGEVRDAYEHGTVVEQSIRNVLNGQTVPLKDIRAALNEVGPDIENTLDFRVKGYLVRTLSLPEDHPVTVDQDLEMFEHVKAKLTEGVLRLGGMLYHSIPRAQRDFDLTPGLEDLALEYGRLEELDIDLEVAKRRRLDPRPDDVVELSGYVESLDEPEVEIMDALVATQDGGTLAQRLSIKGLSVDQYRSAVNSMRSKAALVSVKAAGFFYDELMRQRKKSVPVNVPENKAEHAVVA